MANQIQVKAKLRGLTALLMLPMSDEVLRGLETGQHPPVNKDRSRYEVAEERLYRGPNDEIGIPGECLFSCIVGAGKLLKYDTKRSMTTGDSSLVPSFLTVVEEFFPLTDRKTGKKLTEGLSERRVKKLEEQNLLNREEGYWVDARRGVLQNGTAVSIIRPYFPAWAIEATFILSLEGTPLNPEKVKELVTKAGLAMGLGSYRPSCKGQFGKFTIDRWDVQENGKK